MKKLFFLDPHGLSQPRLLSLALFSSSLFFYIPFFFLLDKYMCTNHYPKSSLPFNFRAHFVIPSLRGPQNPY